MAVVMAGGDISKGGYPGEEIVMIIDDLLSAIDCEAPVREVRQGPFQTAVLTRHCGLASTPHEAGPHHVRKPVQEAGSLTEKTARDLVGMAKSESLYEAAIGMGAINSLLEINEDECKEINARDLISQKGAGKKVAIVGHFPFVPQLKEHVKELWVIEKNPREGDRTEAEAKDFIPRANVVAITGTAFTNHTIEQLLGLCNSKAYVVILGDTAPLSKVLFDYHVDAISGTRVVDYKAVLTCVSEGATYRQIKGIRQLTMVK
jgi:uncharacterized protein (DUF4213/DUF364 family)